MLIYNEDAYFLVSTEIGNQDTATYCAICKSHDNPFKHGYMLNVDIPRPGPTPAYFFYVDDCGVKTVTYEETYSQDDHYIFVNRLLSVDKSVEIWPASPGQYREIKP